MKRCVLLMMLLAALLGCGHRSPVDGATPGAPVTDQQARQMAAEAAAAIARCDHSDTLDLQRNIIDAYATRSQLELDGNPGAAEVFDSGLREELRRIDPQVAAEIFP